MEHPLKNKFVLIPWDGTKNIMILKKNADGFWTDMNSFRLEFRTSSFLEDPEDAFVYLGPFLLLEGDIYADQEDPRTLKEHVILYGDKLRQISSYGFARCIEMNEKSFPDRNLTDYIFKGTDV